MMFLDPDKPLYTCDEESCADCPVSGKLVCHFNGRQLSVFLVLALPLFLAAGYALGAYNPFLLIPWVVFIFSYFGFIEIRVMCSHCPHYAEPDVRSLKCWANYGSPKVWKYRPGPMNSMEKAVFIAGLLVILVPPVVFLLLEGLFLFAAAYGVILILWKVLLNLGFCRRCINFACPFNSVDTETRGVFNAKNSMTGTE